MLQDISGLDQSVYSETRESLIDWLLGWIRNKKGRPYLPNFETRDLLFPKAPDESIVNLGGPSASSRVEVSMEDLNPDRGRISEGSISARREETLLFPLVRATSAPARYPKRMILQSVLRNPSPDASPRYPPHIYWLSRPLLRIPPSRLPPSHLSH